MSDQPTGGLVTAINEVMREVKYLQKTGKNKFHDYKYASEADMKAAIQPAMAKHGLALLPSSITFTTVEVHKTSKGKEQYRTDMRVQFKLLHTSGEHESVEAIGCGIDGEDKGVYKAMTGAIKYAMHSVFLIPTGEDPEKDENATQHEQPTMRYEQPLVYDQNGDPAAFRIVIGPHKGKTLAELSTAELSGLLDGMHEVPANSKTRKMVSFMTQLKEAEREMMERTQPALEPEVQS